MRMKINNLFLLFCIFFQLRKKLVYGYGMGKEETLAHMTARGFEQVFLGFGFNAFHQRLHAQAARQVDDVAGDLAGHRRGAGGQAG